jgi:translation initiation factor 1
MARERDTRLVYSTGGPVPPSMEKDARPAPTAGKAGIRVRLDRRASGRVVTVVSGLPGPTPAVEALGRELRAACGAGGTARGDAIELQGDHRVKVEAALLARGLRFKRAGG